jgi:hypothetical protein
MDPVLDPVLMVVLACVGAALVMAAFWGSV